MHVILVASIMTSYACDIPDVYTYLFTYMHEAIYTHTHIYIYIYIKHFAWEDQREKECYIFHKVARWKIKHYVEYIEPLCGIYSTVMKTILLLL